MKTTTTNHAEQTAAAVCKARINDIARLLDVLQMELETHVEETTGKQRWNDANTLQRIRTLLIESLECSSGSGREEIEDFLSQ